MPQLNQLGDVAFSQFFWLLLTLAVIYFGIGRAMLPKIQSTVDARNDRIASDLAAAQQAKTEAEATEEAYRLRMDQSRAEAVELARVAKEKATAAGEKRVRAADAELADKASAAEASLAADRTAATGEIEKAAAEAVEAILAKLTGLKITQSEAAKAVKAAMANV